MSAALLKRRDNPFRCRRSIVHLVLNSDKAVKGPGGGGAQVVEILDVWVNFSVLEIKLIDEAQPCHKIYTTQKPEDWNNQGDNEVRIIVSLHNITAAYQLVYSMLQEPEPLVILLSDMLACILKLKLYSICQRTCPL